MFTSKSCETIDLKSMAYRWRSSASQRWCAQSEVSAHRDMIRHKKKRWTKGQVHSADGYLWCIRTERKVHVHLQRDGVSNALPLRQTILFYNKTVIQSECYETGASISALILLLKWTLKPTAIKYLPAVFEKHYHQPLNKAFDRLFLFTVHTGILNNHC